MIRSSSGTPMAAITAITPRAPSPPIIAAELWSSTPRNAMTAISRTAAAPSRMPIHRRKGLGLTMLNSSREFNPTTAPSVTRCRSLSQQPSWDSWLFCLVDNSVVACLSLLRLGRTRRECAMVEVVLRYCMGGRVHGRWPMEIERYRPAAGVRHGTGPSCCRSRAELPECRERSAGACQCSDRIELAVGRRLSSAAYLHPRGT